ncbi:MAG: S8 family serine peptidase, partial [Actinomycetota bacterium]
MSGNPPAAPPAAGGILVAFKQPIGLQSRLNALDRAGVSVDPKVQSPFFARVVLTPGARGAGIDTKTALRQLQRDPAVRVAEPDYAQHTLATPNDTRYGELWGLHNTGQSGGSADADIDAPEAWELNQGSDSVVVAVIDTGVDYNHPDLTQNILRNASNQVIGFDYANNDPDPMDDNDHGTHCAGTIGGRGNNGQGVVGVNWRVKIMPLKFLSAGGSGNTSAAIQCIDFARTNGARVMSNSWGGGGFSQLLLEAIQRARTANILFIAAAGNDSENTDATPHYPSSYAVENVVSVGASDRNDQRASFSNYGAATVDLFAPGASIVSTTPNNTYSSFSGTSMATPHVAGAAALVLAQFPTLTADQIKSRIFGGVDLPASFGGLCVTGGRLNMNNSLDTDTTAPGPPTNLRATHRASSAVLLAWTSAGDDGSSGAASRFDVRYSTQVITAANFATAAQALNAPAPLPAGSAHSLLIAGLDPNTSYHFAIRAIDNVGNLSAIATAGPVATLTVDCPLDDNVEGSPRFTGQSPWGVTTAASASPTRSYTDSPSGQYANSVDVSLTQTSAVAITGGASLTFKAKYQLETGYDYLYIEVSADNGATWQRQSLVLNGTADWTTFAVPLTLQSGSVRARFRLITDSSVTYDGVYLDDIKICISPVTTVFAETVEGAPQLSGGAPWAVTTEASASPTHSYTDSPGGAYGNSVDLSLTTNASPALSNVIPTLTFNAKTDLEPGYDRLYVEASTNGGSTWQRLSLSLTDVNDWRGYSISLSQYLGQNVKLRFRLITDGSVTGNGVWLDDIRISGPELVPVGVPCLVTVSAPNGGESWAPSSNQTVGWTSQGLTGNVNIELSTDGGNSYAMLQAGVPNDGSQIVTVPDAASSQCRIRVSAVNDSSCQDVSNANFTIGALPCTVTVSTPNGGERWAQATNQTVSWSSQNLVGDVKIELSTNDGTSFTTLLANTPNDGSQSVTLPSTPSIQCRVRVSAVNDANCQDVSNANFTIYDPVEGGPTFVLANGLLSPGGNVALNLQFTASGAQPVTAAGFDLLFDTTKITAVSATRGSL